MTPVTETEYPVLALRTLCPDQQIDLTCVSHATMMEVLGNFVQASRALDALKKITVYGKNRPADTVDGAFRPAAPVDPQVYHAILGIATEGGELVEALLHTLRNGEPLDRVNLKEELGDLEWFEALLRDRLKLTPEEVRTANIAKLEARYAKKKFDAEAALKRDHDAERKALQ